MANTPAKTTTRKPYSRGSRKNCPTIGDNGLMLEPGDNTKFLQVQVELYNMPNIDMENPVEVAKRLSDYFMLYGQNDMKPTVAGMAIALNGHNRRWLWSVTHDKPYGSNMVNLNSDSIDTIKKAYFMLENLWETYMNSGKVNPVAGIFLGKNNYDYQDKTETVITPNVNLDSDYDADQIRQQYITDSATDSATDSDAE